MEIFFHWLLGPLWGIVMGRAEATRQATLLWTLAAAVEKHFPLVAFLETVADEAGGSWQRKVRGLAELIAAGTSIPDALEAMPGILPSETIAMIRIGSQTGNMIGALREGARLARRRGEEPTADFQGTLLYLTVILLALTTVGAFIMIWIIPKYKAIFNGFDVKLPALTETVIGFCDGFSRYWFLGFPLFLLALLGLWSFMSLGLELMGLGAVWNRSRALSAQFLPRLKSPHLLRCLSIAVEGGRPLPEALQLLADRHPDIPFRRSLDDISNEVASGSNCWLVLRAARMLRRGEPVLLEAAQRVGNLTWALRGMADRIERRSEYRYQLLVEVMDPILFLLVGTIIGTFCLSIFLPLVELLHKLS